MEFRIFIFTFLLGEGLEIFTFYFLPFTLSFGEVCEVFSFYLFLVTSFLDKIVAFYTSFPDIIKSREFEVEGIAVSI